MNLWEKILAEKIVEKGGFSKLEKLVNKSAFFKLIAFGILYGLVVRAVCQPHPTLLV